MRLTTLVLAPSSVHVYMGLYVISLVCFNFMACGGRCEGRFPVFQGFIGSKEALKVVFKAEYSL